MSLLQSMAHDEASAKYTPSELGEGKAWPGDKAKTTVLINLAGIMERMDEQILPALYNSIGQSFNATPSQLGTLTLCRALVQALSSPLGGLSGEPYKSSRVIAYLGGFAACTGDSQLDWLVPYARCEPLACM